MISRLILIILMIPLLSIAEQGKTNGNNLGKEMVDLHGSADSAKQTLFNPMMTSEKMSTLSDSWKCPATNTVYTSANECADNCSEACMENNFDIELQCNSQTEVLTVNPVNFVYGGEVQLRVSYDADLDGTQDSNFTTLPVSGFCTNGYVSCSPSGSWNGCRYFEFGIRHKCGSTTFDTYRQCKDACSSTCQPAEDRVRAIERSYLQMRHVGGCFCSNASCGSSFNAAFNEALGYFGGGISGHLMNELDIAVSDTKFDTATMSVKYMAVDPASCTDSNDSVDSLKATYQTGSISYDSELLSQMSDSDSMYNTVMAQNNSQTETNDCTITNTPAITSTPAELVEVVIGKKGNDYWSGYCAHYSKTTEFYIEDLNEVSEFKLTRLVFDDWIKITINGHVAYVGPKGGDRLDVIDNRVYYTETNSGSCELGKSWNYGVDVDVKPYLINGANTAIVDVIVGGEGEGYAYLTGVIGGKDEISVQRTDSCALYSGDESCQLYEETVNDEYDTYLNYNATGILPATVCDEYSGSAGKYIICDYGDRFDITSSLLYVPSVTGTHVIPDNTVRTISARNDGLERYKISRTYICTTDSGYDFSDAKAQADMIGSTLDRDTGDFNYLNDGETAAGNIAIETDSFDNCTYSCVVQTGNTDTEVFPDQQTRPDVNTPVIEERPCGVDRNTMERSCPYDASNETMIENCSCTDHFSEVVTTFGALYEAAKDMICSQD
jgi:hypothetical protein